MFPSCFAHDLWYTISQRKGRCSEHAEHAETSGTHNITSQLHDCMKTPQHENTTKPEDASMWRCRELNPEVKQRDTNNCKNNHNSDATYTHRLTLPLSQQQLQEQPQQRWCSVGLQQSAANMHHIRNSQHRNEATRQQSNIRTWQHDHTTAWKHHYT